MKYLPLIWSALTRRKVRTFFTLLSVLAAFVLFGLLDSVNGAFAHAGHSVTAAHRLITTSKMGLMFPLPLALYTQIALVPGVQAVTHENWFGGYYRRRKNFFSNIAVARNFFDLYPEFKLPPRQLRAFRNTRTGAVVGAALARRFHWKLGDQIPLKASIFPRKDGSDTWTFDLVGIYRDPAHEGQENALFFHWQYFDEAAAFGNGKVGWYVERIADPGRSGRIARAIDALSANSDHETRTQTSSAFAADMISQFANIGLIVSAIMAAVFFTLILLTGNTMAQAVRERIPELGILKTVGFTHRAILSLVLAESVLVVLIGGIAGMALAAAAVSVIQAKYGARMPMLPVGAWAWLRAVGLMVLIGLVVGALPARRGMRLRIVDALAGR